MVGDVNLFLNDVDDKHTAEIEIMIAGNGTQRILNVYVNMYSSQTGSSVSSYKLYLS